MQSGKAGGKIDDLIKRYATDWGRMRRTGLSRADLLRRFVEEVTGAAGSHGTPQLVAEADDWLSDSTNWDWERDTPRDAHSIVKRLRDALGCRGARYVTCIDCGAPGAHGEERCNSCYWTGEPGRIGRPAGDLPPWAWFGEPTGAPSERDWPRIDNPGGSCDYFRCGAPIVEGESGFVLPFHASDGARRVVQHRDCYLFSIGVGKRHADGEPCNCGEFKHLVGT